MLDSLCERFDVSEHHRGTAATTKFVPDSHHIQPVIGHDFAAGNFAADSIDKNFRPTTGKTAQSGVLESARGLLPANSG